MFNFFNKSNPKHQELTWKLKGLHCSSCTMNIDLALEEVKGIIKVKTDYSKSQTKITIDPELVKLSEITKILNDLGYQVVDLD